MGIAAGCTERAGSADDHARAAQAAPGGAAAAALAPVGTGLPSARATRFVKFVALSERNGHSFTAVAEFKLIDGNGFDIDRKRWVASADSADINDVPAHAIDGDPNSLWHSRWQGTPAPLPHALTIDLGLTSKVAGFRYIARRDNTQNGAVGEYGVYFSDDGVNWGAAVATGDLAKVAAIAGEQTVVFARQTVNQAPHLVPPPAQQTTMGERVSLQLAATDADADPLRYTAQGLPPGLTLAAATGLITGTPIGVGRHVVQIAVSDPKELSATTTFDWVVQPAAPLAEGRAAAAGEVRFVKLEALTEINGKPWSSLAEFNVLDRAGQPVPRQGWVASADSADASDKPDGAIDGNTASIWHSQWDGASPALPHSLVVDLGHYQRVGGFRVLPRQDKLTNGVIARYRFYTSVDGVTWGQAVAEGDFSAMGSVQAEKTVMIK